MKVDLSGSGVLALAAVGVVGVAAFVLYSKRGAIAQGITDAGNAVGQAVNPTSDKNLAYRGVNAVGSAVSGDSSWSLGTWVYDLLHPDEDRRIADALGLQGSRPAVDTTIADRWDSRAKYGPPGGASGGW